MRPSLVPLSAATLLLAACGAPDDPQLAMCQAVAKQLTGDTVAAWERTEQSDGSRARHVVIAYSTTDDGSGSIDCRFPIDREDGTVATAPDAVELDGQEVPTKELIAAGTRASGELIAGTAAETAARTRELAEDAGDKAREVAERAREVTVEGAKAVQEALDR